jgi:serine/threonine-protein kinase HipA
MSDQLEVHYRTHPIGVITQRESGLMYFRYGDAWIESPQAFPISLSLPLDGSFGEAASHHFFANLLPEGNVREQICRSLKISVNNDFQLLKAIGGDCAGALTITDSDLGPPSHPTSQQYEPVTEEQLALWSAGTPDAFSAVTGQNEVRLSLAGAQDKLPVHVDGDQLLIPLGNAPSTHILKFASPFYSHLPENETFITLLAQEVGLAVVDIRVRKSAKAPVALITRYDRRWSSGEWIRLHQEDFCQALGISPARKYEKEGGPSLRQCVEIIRRHTSFPLADLQRLLQWTLFNLLVGNSDGHGKNLSLLYEAGGAPKLAPFYDLVCTRNYKKIAREMAMNLGGAWDPDLISAKHLEQLAHDFAFRPSVVGEQTTSLCDKVSTRLPTVMEKYASRFGDSAVLERLPQLIRKLLRRLESQLQ